METLGYMLGGIGVFFVGLHLLSSGLKQLAGRRFRLHFARWVGTDTKAGVMGFTAGFLSQSMSALAFIISSLVGAGILPVRRGMLVIFWANAGIGIMILLAVLNIKALVLLLLGVTGVAFAFKRPRGYEAVCQAFFGGAMLFYGLIMLRTGAEPLAAMPWFEAALAYSHSSALLAFGVGAILTALCQSSTAVSILAIALTQVGLFSMEQTMMLIYGANVGSGMISWLLSGVIQGTARQLVMTQVFFNFIAAAVFVPLFYLETLAGVPLVKALMQSLNLPLEQQAALVYLLFNWGGAIVLTLLVGPFQRIVARLYPAAEEEKWSRPHYLRDEGGEAPEVTLGLLVREQSRLLCFLARYCNLLLNPPEAAQCSHTVEKLHGAYETVSREVNVRASETIRQPLSHDGVELLVIIQNKQKQIDALENLLYQFTPVYSQLQGALQQAFQTTFLQGLEFLLNTACEADVSGDAEDVQQLMRLTRDRGDVFQSVRAAYLQGEHTLSMHERNTFLELTGLFERMVWTLGRLASLQHAQKEMGRA